MGNNKLYFPHILKTLQNAVKSGQVTITPYKDYSFISNGIVSCGALLKFYIDSSTGKHCRYVRMPDDMTTELMKIWKTYPIYKFLFNDWKENKLDFIGNTVYSVVIYNDNNNIKHAALIRKLEEINEDTIEEHDKLQFIKDNCDLIIDDRYYAVLKITTVSEHGIYNWVANDKKSYITYNAESNNSTEEYSDEMYTVDEQENIDEGLF